MDYVKIARALFEFVILVAQTMVHTNRQTGFLQLTRAFAAKAADVSGRLLRAKGASFGSLRRWSWDILPLLLPSTQTHDCSLHPLGNSAETNIKGSVGRSGTSEVFQLKYFIFLLIKTSPIVIAELYLAKVKPNDASTWLTPSTHTHTKHVPHNALQTPTNREESHLQTCHFFNDT